MKILSLFDGMSCGMLAMLAAGVTVDRYDAYEIDKHAITASKHNFPQIIQHGDVFAADFTEYEGYDFLIGGSPCTYWSIARSPDKRETTASGIGWELFSQYVRALHEARPRFFIYENNRSMSKEIRASITEAFGFEPICINSGLVSAQNRQRLYWIGARNPDGTYRKADIPQPADRGILLKDVLDSARPLTDKGRCLAAPDFKYKPIIGPQRVGTMPRERDGIQTQGQAFRIYSPDGKSVALKAESGGAGGKTGLYATHGEPQKEQRVYTVQDGQIEVNGRRYPIKLRDGRYIIRKLTVTECMRLQTVPEWYDFSCVSKTQAYKMLGNGWTVEVIAHLIRYALRAGIF